MSSTVQVGDKLVNLDQVSTFVAAYLSWARQARVYATFHPVISYRGHCSSQWKLLPTLCRQKQPVEMLKQIEAEVIAQFQSRFDLIDYSSTEVLAYARHHGAPTRLLDWSRNPFVGLWFAVCDKQHDATAGEVFQLNLQEPNKLIALGACFKLETADACCCKHPIHIFTSPPRIERSHRQRSVFTIASFDNDCAVRPLDEVCSDGPKHMVRRFPVPANIKAELRRLLSDLALDAYSIYGDPDSFGKALGIYFDLSDLKVPSELPTDSGVNDGSKFKPLGFV